jgi:hypothetical protein
VASGERINVAHLELALRLPMEYIPDPRTVIEDAQDKEKEERDAAERRKVSLSHKVNNFYLERRGRENGQRSSKASQTGGEKEEV